MSQKYVTDHMLIIKRKINLCNGVVWLLHLNQPRQREVRKVVFLLKLFILNVT